MASAQLITATNRRTYRLPSRLRAPMLARCSDANMGSDSGAPEPPSTSIGFSYSHCCHTGKGGEISPAQPDPGAEKGTARHEWLWWAARRERVHPAPPGSVQGGNWARRWILAMSQARNKVEREKIRHVKEMAT